MLFRATPGAITFQVVWDTSAQIRWFVLPERPAGIKRWTEEQLAAIVTPEAM